MTVIFLVRTTVLLALSSLAVVSALAMQRPGRGRDVERLYADSCANCHGPKLTGAQGPSLVDDEWKHGSDDASIAKSIHDGQPAAGMPPFGGALSAQEIRALVIYIREEGAKARRAHTTIREARRQHLGGQRAARLPPGDGHQRRRRRRGASRSCRTAASS